MQTWFIVVWQPPIPTSISPFKSPEEDSTMTCSNRAFYLHFVALIPGLLSLQAKLLLSLVLAPLRFFNYKIYFPIALPYNNHKL